jgi:hypothetical protein
MMDGTQRYRYEYFDAIDAGESTDDVSVILKYFPDATALERHLIVHCWLFRATPRPAPAFFVAIGEPTGSSER